jgi:hypothetical protein
MRAPGLVRTGDPPRSGIRRAVAGPAGASRTGRRTRPVVSPGCVRSTGGLLASSQERSGSAPRAGSSVRSPTRCERRIAALLVPGEQLPESVRDVPGRFGIHGDDAHFDRALGGRDSVVTGGACPGHGTARVVSRGPTVPRAEDETSPVTGVRNTLDPPHRTPGIPGATPSGRGRRTVETPRASRTPAATPGRPRLERNTEPPQRSARRRVGIMSAAVEATPGTLVMAAPVPRARTGPRFCRGEA